MVVVAAPSTTAFCGELCQGAETISFVGTDVHGLGVGLPSTKTAPHGRDTGVTVVGAAPDTSGSGLVILEGGTTTHVRLELVGGAARNTTRFWRIVCGARVGGAHQRRCRGLWRWGWVQIAASISFTETDGHLVGHPDVMVVVAAPSTTAFCGELCQGAETISFVGTDVHGLRVGLPSAKTAPHRGDTGVTVVGAAPDTSGSGLVILEGGTTTHIRLELVGGAARNTSPFR